MMCKILICCLLVILYKFSSNLLSYVRIQKYKAEYLEFLKNGTKKIQQHSTLTVSLFKKAGVEDRYFSMTQPIGYGQMEILNTSTFENFPSHYQPFSQYQREMFEDAIGIYRSRTLESFNPIYWIDLIVFMPRNVLGHIGVDKTTTRYKITNILLTFFWWAFTTLVAIFQPELKQYISSLFPQL